MSEREAMPELGTRTATRTRAIAVCALLPSPGTPEYRERALKQSADCVTDPAR